jgi:hypothetical protein
MLHQINTRTNNYGKTNAISKISLMNNFDELVLDMIDECLSALADHFDAFNKNTHRGLCNRDSIDFLFGGVYEILCMDPLQHIPVGGGLLWYGKDHSIQQAFLAVRQRDNATAQNKLLGIAAGTTLFQQFTKFIVLDTNETR